MTGDLKKKHSFAVWAALGALLSIHSAPAQERVTVFEGARLITGDGSTIEDSALL